MVLSTPFGANKKWIATKFESYASGNKLGPLEWKLLDELWNFYTPEQIFSAILDFKKICDREHRHFDFRAFKFYCEVSGNVPSKRLAEVICLRVHYPKDPFVAQLYIDVRTADEAWNPDPELERKIAGCADKIAELRVRL